MQNTDVKQTKNQTFLFQRQYQKVSPPLKKKKKKKNNSVELGWHKNYNIEQGTCVHADHTINMPSTSVQRAENKNITSIRSNEKGPYTNQLFFKKKSICNEIKSEFLQMFTQLPFFLSNSIFCFYLDLHKFQKCLKIRAILLKFAPVNVKFLNKESRNWYPYCVLSSVNPSPGSKPNIFWKVIKFNLSQHFLLQKVLKLSHKGRTLSQSQNIWM